MTLFGLDPVRAAVEDALGKLEDSEPVTERQILDLKEEAGRRGAGGALLPGEAQDEAAAQHLADECACMANTPGGGALIVGVTDQGQVIGTRLDEEWLRARLYDLLERRLTVDIRPVTIRGERLLVIVCPSALEPIRRRGKVNWRVGDRCVEIDAATWHQRRHDALNVWSRESSGVPVSRARAVAIGVARDFLAASPDPGAQELAEASTPDLLRRLNAVTGDGYLTQAGALVFVGREAPCLDYIRRDVAGGDSVDRVRRSDRSLIEQLAEVFALFRAYNPVRHIDAGLAIGQVRQLPDRAAREAIVNGVAHREWAVAAPTVVEHIGGTLRVSSPGGFYGGVSAENIINHPSSSRNTSLTELLAALKVAEREGIGVDRMVGDMLRVGYPMPDIRQIEGPYVVTTLVGDVIDTAWVAWLRMFDDQAATRDLRLLMSLRRLVTHGWLDVDRLAPFLQLPLLETDDVIRRLADLTIGGGDAVVADVLGVPPDLAPAIALSGAARQAHLDLDARLDRRRQWPSRAGIALDYARARGRISSTELASLVGADRTNVGRVLRDLEDAGDLVPSRANRRGAGFYYRPAPDGLDR